MTEEQLTAYKDKVNQAQSLLQKIQGYSKLPARYRHVAEARTELLRHLAANNPYLPESDIAEILTKALEGHVEFLIAEAHKELQALWEGPVTSDTVKELEVMVRQAQDNRQRLSEADQAIINNPPHEFLPAHERRG